MLCHPRTPLVAHQSIKVNFEFGLQMVALLSCCVSVEWQIVYVSPYENQIQIIKYRSPVAAFWVSSKDVLVQSGGC